MGDDDNLMSGEWWRQGEGCTLLSGGSSVAQANVYVVSDGEQRVLVKTFRNHPALIRATWGRWVLRRESRLLARLCDVQGIPDVIGFDPATVSLAISYISDARPLVDSRETLPDEYPSLEFFGLLRGLLDAMHQCGVGHGDIRRKNILMDSSGRPHVIDFATAVECSPDRMGPRRLLYRMFVRTDMFSVLKIQHSYYPESLSEEDRKHVFEHPWYVSLGRFLRQHVYKRFIKQKHWRERLRHLRESVGALGAVPPSKPSHPDRETESTQHEASST